MKFSYMSGYRQFDDDIVLVYYKNHFVGSTVCDRLFECELNAFDDSIPTEYLGCDDYWNIFIKSEFDETINGYVYGDFTLYFLNPYSLRKQDDGV